MNNYSRIKSTNIEKLGSVHPEAAEIDRAPEVSELPRSFTMNSKRLPEKLGSVHPGAAEIDRAPEVGDPLLSFFAPNFKKLTEKLGSVHPEAAEIDRAPESW
ncbi:MAG: hypothetical protein ACHP6H_01940 [Legionellales bacterium]